MHRHVCLVGLFIFLLLPCITMSSEDKHPDKFIAKKKIAGRLVSYDTGDYVHVTVKAKDGTEVDFFIGVEACFLAQHHDQILKIEYNEVESYFWEGGGYYPANFIQTIVTKDGKSKWDARKDDKLPSGINYDDCLDDLGKVNNKKEEN